MNPETKSQIRQHAKHAIKAWRGSKNAPMPGIWIGLGDWNARQCHELGGLNERKMRDALTFARGRMAHRDYV